MYTFLYLPNKIINKQTNCQCPIALFSVFTKVISEIKDVSFAIVSKKMLFIWLFFTERNDMLIKKKHVFTDIGNLKLEKYYVLFSAFPLLLSDIL